MQSTVISTPREKGFRKTLPSLERSVHVVAERELNPKLRVEEEEEGVKMGMTGTQNGGN